MVENKKYQIIFTDPPWDYGGQTQHAGKNSADTGGAITHYPTMKTEDIISTFKDLVNDWADKDCL